LTSITCSLFIHTKIFNKFFLKHAECYRCWGQEKYKYVLNATRTKTGPFVRRLVLF
jgi:hypothetical protein